MSADSGVPTFRGEDGLWKRHRPEELATPRAFERDPRLVWEWYAWRREVVSGCDPNEGHLALARWASRRADVRIVTQNVDGLHDRAATLVSGGDRGGAALELHGSLFRVRCTGCARRAPHREPVDATAEATLPRCSACGGLLRPDVVWFGEPLDRAALERAFAWAASSSVCLVVGTSAVVQPAASLAVATHEAGGTIVEVNPDDTPLTPLARVSLRGGAAELLPSLLD